MLAETNGTGDGAQLSHHTRSLLQEAIHNATGLFMQETQQDLRADVEHYTGEIAKTVPLFLIASKGSYAAAALMYGLDQVHTGQTISSQATDFAMGAAKGALTKGTFDLIARESMDVAARGLTMGVTSRLIDQSLTRETYMDRSGNFSLGHGVSDTFKGTFNPTMLAADVALFGTAHGVFRGLNSAAAGALERSPLVQTIATSASFGLVSGAGAELQRQQSNNEQIDLTKIAQRGLLEAGVMSLAGAPGGMQAGRIAAQDRREMLELIRARMQDSGPLPLFPEGRLVNLNSLPNPIADPASAEPPNIGPHDLGRIAGDPSRRVVRFPLLVTDELLRTRVGATTHEGGTSTTRATSKPVELSDFTSDVLQSPNVRAVLDQIPHPRLMRSAAEALSKMGPERFSMDAVKAVDAMMASGWAGKDYDALDIRAAQAIIEKGAQPTFSAVTNFENGQWWNQKTMEWWQRRSLQEAWSRGFKDEELNDPAIRETVMKISSPEVIQAALTALRVMGREHFEPSTVRAVNAMLDAGWQPQNITTHDVRTAEIIISVDDLAPTREHVRELQASPDYQPRS